jgi:hypothetical protein
MVTLDVTRWRHCSWLIGWRCHMEDVCVKFSWYISGCFESCYRLSDRLDAMNPRRFSQHPLWGELAEKVGLNILSMTLFVSDVVMTIINSYQKLTIYISLSLLIAIREVISAARWNIPLLLGQSAWIGPCLCSSIDSITVASSMANWSPTHLNSPRGPCLRLQPSTSN